MKNAQRNMTEDVMLDVTEDMMTDMMEDSGGYDGGDDRV